jgi:PAS domain S-box-containing protein
MMPRRSQAEVNQLLSSSMLQAPFNVAVINRDHQIVAANENFQEYFGTWRDRYCYQVYKGQSRICDNCQSECTFADGRVRVSDEIGIDRHGRACQYVLHISPLKDKSGAISHVVQITTDLTETRTWQRQYDLLFERVPCAAFVIDRSFHLIRVNARFRQTFGDPDGKCCYQVCKRRKTPCRECTAVLTFRDGNEHVSSEVGVHRDGTPAYYFVTSSPLSRSDAGVVHVIQMATDITQVYELEQELRKTQDFYQVLIENAPAGILAVDPAGDPKLMNPAARKLLGWTSAQLPGAARLKELLPQELSQCEECENKLLDLPEMAIRSTRGEAIPVHFSAVELKSGRQHLGCAAFLEDLSGIKRLEQEKLEAERLAAVGQTVAGLAHTIKNLLMGIEGGMYMVNSGLSRGDTKRIASGWQMLQRNFEKTTALVKDFLSFAKGRIPELHPTDPNALVRDIRNLYVDAARMQNVELVLEVDPQVSPAPLDRQAMETCLTNLLSNAVDAAATRADKNGKVALRTREEDGALIFEVVDNGSGIDPELREKLFTTFFTTKGTKGTGLGLLTTRKIVQEHGGRMELDSTPGEGSTFRIRLSRERLQAIARDATFSIQPSSEVMP